MSEAEEAYAAAVAEIARVKARGERKLKLSGPKFAALETLPDEIVQLDKVRWLDLRGTQISDAGLGRVKGMVRLRTLILGGTQISDAGLEQLQGMKELGVLDLSNSKIRDAGLEQLRRIVKLQILNLSKTKISDSGLVQLQNLSGLQVLDLSNSQISDMGIGQLQGMAGLQRLALRSTQVVDITPLVLLKKLGHLDLTGTGVRDLRPICHLPVKAGWPFRGLHFANTPAAALDPRLGELAQIKNDADRTEKTLEYLRGLPKYPAPLPWLVEDKPLNNAPREDQKEPAPPEQDPALPLIWGERGFTFLANRVDADEVTEAALEDLRALLEDLRRKGNRHDDLYRLAGELQERSTGEIAELKMVKLHISYQKLRRLYEAREGRAERFDDETVGVLGSVLGIVPAVTLADQAVKELIARQEADRLVQKEPEIAAAERGVLEAIADQDAPFDEAVQDAARAILEPNQQDRLAATGGILARNSFVSVFRFLRYDPIGAGLSSATMILFVQGYGQTFLTFAQTMGSDAFLWAQMVLAGLKSETQIAVGVAREMMGMGAAIKPTKAKRPKE
jgi:internalin A